MVASGGVAVSGATGFVGSRVCRALSDEGYEVWPMVRKPSKDPHAIFYDYDKKKIDLDKLSECIAVIHLAGKNVMSGLWTSQFKQELYDSRIKSTRLIAHSLAKLHHGPKILLNASAIGIYGNRADQKLDEESRPGTGFLAKLCVDWERATQSAKKASIRTVNMRISAVLDRDGGILKTLAPISSLGLLGPIGSGEQYMSYVTRDELAAQIIFLLKHDTIEGPVNMVAIEPTTNKEFVEALGAIKKRPTFLRIPATLLKLLGEQGEMMLSSARVYPKALLDHGYIFDDHQGIAKALREIFY